MKTNSHHAASEKMSNPIIDAQSSEAMLTAEHNHQEEMLSRIGHVTRSLHENLRGLGFDKILDKVATDIPDARDRLNYVAKMTEQAADRVLNATDAATPLQSEIAAQAAHLEASWQSLLASRGLKSEYDEIAHDTLAFLDQTKQNAAQTKMLLTDIMMAQDFQDLTGQVIKKITSLAQDLEQQLVQVLVDFSPSTVKKETNTGLLNGPQIHPNENADAVATQAQVDDLLDSLGF